jgi:hypothetical protein
MRLNETCSQINVRHAFPIQNDLKQDSSKGCYQRLSDVRSEDEGSEFLRNFDNDLPDYRRHNSYHNLAVGPQNLRPRATSWNWPRFNFWVC